MKKNYRFDIDLLKDMKQQLKQDKSIPEFLKHSDLEKIEVLLHIDRHFKIPLLLSRFKLLKENQFYVEHYIEETQKQYLLSLKEHLQLIDMKSGHQKQATIEEVLTLFEQFISWFPSKQLKPFLELYYEKKFPTHFCYAKKEWLNTNRGVTYSFDNFEVPFVIVRSETLIETFMTLVHEMGHVLLSLLGISIDTSKCAFLFSELPGRYFELLALQFLMENKIERSDAIKSAIQSYNEMKYYNIEDSHLWKTFFTCDSVEENLSQIYSYLGALELWSRDQKDYEKQLFDLKSIAQFQSDSVTEYLKVIGFDWRNNEFLSLKQHRQYLLKSKNTNSSYLHTL